MATVLGIDAAWTVRQPSGVAVIRDAGDGWRLLALEPSYERFLEPTSTMEHPDVRGSLPDAKRLLERAARIAGEPVSLVAVDMPLSREPITGRRESDNAISRAFGAAACSTHSPTSERPGALSDRLREDFARLGFKLATEAVVGPALVEVYPHPALLLLMGKKYRVPYKESKKRKYWPELTPVARRERLFAEWEAITTNLEEHVSGLESQLRLPTTEASGRELKACEDMLDAAVCAWVGAWILEGRAKAYGDSMSAIWVPE